ncbi:MAG: hypothetical protein KKF65_01120 [Nanoarchaeota archaeon]|nr:hypothetical protein [Nanoarchaeota archaeon]
MSGEKIIDSAQELIDSMKNRLCDVQQLYISAQERLSLPNTSQDIFNYNCEQSTVYKK